MWGEGLCSSQGEVLANGATGGSGDGERIPACSSGAGASQGDARHISPPREQGADVLFAFSVQPRGFPPLGFGEESLTPQQPPPKCCAHPL